MEPELEEASLLTTGRMHCRYNVLCLERAPSLPLARPPYELACYVTCRQTVGVWGKRCANRYCSLKTALFYCRRAYGSVTASQRCVKNYRGADKSLAQPTSLSIVFSVQGTGGSPTGPDPENRVGDQDIVSPGRPVSSGLQVLGEQFPSWSG
jgi:hypothetical protein